MAEVSVRIHQVSKKFSRTFKSSMRHGVRDVSRDILGLKRSENFLRPEEFWSLRDVSFTVEPGECVALLGPNGAGKSTMLKMLSGIFLPTTGRIEIYGRTGALIELGSGFHPMLTGRENVYINGSILGMSRAEIDERFKDILEFSGIGDFIDSPVRYYSSGMYVRLGFAVAAQVRPNVLLIDEVLAVGDYGFRMKCFKHLLKLLDEGISIIVVSHAVFELMRISDRAVVLNKGRVTFDGELSKGIGVYQNLLNLTDEDLKIKPRKRNPDGEVEKKSFIPPKYQKQIAEMGGKDPGILKVQSVDADGNPKEDFMTGDTMYLDIQAFSSKPMDRLRLSVNFMSPAQGDLGSISTPYSDFWFGIKSQVKTIRLCMPEIPLLVGGYHVDVTLYGPEIDDHYHCVRSTGHFRIIGPPCNTFGYGICHTFKFDHHWQEIESE